jgi:hypothetical protein
VENNNRHWFIRGLKLNFNGRINITNGLGIFAFLAFLILVFLIKKEGKARGLNLWDINCLVSYLLFFWAVCHLLFSSQPGKS